MIKLGELQRTLIDYALETNNKELFHKLTIGNERQKHYYLAERRNKVVRLLEEVIGIETRN